MRSKLWNSHPTFLEHRGFYCLKLSFSNIYFILQRCVFFCLRWKMWYVHWVWEMEILLFSSFERTMFPIATCIACLFCSVYFLKYNMICRVLELKQCHAALVLNIFSNKNKVVTNFYKFVTWNHASLGLQHFYGSFWCDHFCCSSWSFGAFFW